MRFCIFDCSFTVFIFKVLALPEQNGSESGIVGPLIESVQPPHLPVKVKRYTSGCRYNTLKQVICFVPRQIHTHSESERETAHKIRSIGNSTKTVVSILQRLGHDGILKRLPGFSIKQVIHIGSQERGPKGFEGWNNSRVCPIDDSRDIVLVVHEYDRPCRPYALRKTGLPQD